MTTTLRELCSLSRGPVTLYGRLHSGENAREEAENCWTTDPQQNKSSNIVHPWASFVMGITELKQPGTVMIGVEAINAANGSIVERILKAFNN